MAIAAVSQIHEHLMIVDWNEIGKDHKRIFVDLTVGLDSEDILLRDQQRSPPPRSPPHLVVVVDGATVVVVVVVSAFGQPVRYVVIFTIRVR